FERLISRNRKPFVLDLPPQDLDQIELRAIGRKKQQIEPLLFPTLNSRFERRTRLNGRVVEDDQRGLLHPLAVVIKTLDQDLAIDRALKDIGLERSVEVEKAQDVESLRMNAWNFQGLSAKLPGIGHAWDQTEADPHQNSFSAIRRIPTFKDRGFSSARIYNQPTNLTTD